MADPMTPERLADRRKKIKAEHVERRYFYGAECSCGECLPCVVLADELAWLDGVERLRVELEKIHTTETDVTWLADGVRRLIDGVSIRTAKDPAAAQARIAREVASHINAGILTAFVSSRVVDLSVEHIRQAETERDAAREQVKDTEQAVHGFFADADQRGVHLDGMTVDELCDAVMAAIRTEPGR